MTKRRYRDDAESSELDAGPLFALARASDPVTSAGAAESLSAETLEGVSALIVEACRGAGAAGMTTLELEAFLHIQRVSISPRMRSLAERGRLVAGPLRKGPNGRTSVAWRVP